MEIVIRVELGQISGIFAGLIIFGIFYNALTAWLERKGYMEGFTSLLVAAGVATTLAPFALLNLPFVLIVGGGFICSGASMIIGSISRYMAKRARAQRILAGLNHGDTTKRVA